MKTIACQPACLRKLCPYLIVLGLFYFSLATAWAQNHGSHFRASTQQLQPAEAPTLDQLAKSRGYHRAKRGYWRLRTDYAKRFTLIEIFTWEKKLVYQERLPGKYLKMSLRNTQFLDQLCDRLLENQLIASQVKSLPLPEEAHPDFYRNAATSAALPTEVMLPLDAETLQANAVLNETGKLKALFRNPTLGNVSVWLSNENGDVLYQEFSRLASYHRTFDLRDLGKGIYTLKIQNNREKYVRQLRLDYSDKRLIAQWISPPEPLPMDLLQEPLVDRLP
jgi:hypothetical protein